MKILCAAALIAASSAAFADFEIIDQIGDDNDTFNIGTGAVPSTDYDPNTPFDYFAIDNFTIDAPTRITRIDALYALQSAFGFPVDRWRVSIFSSTDVALEQLDGDVYVEIFDEPTLTIPAVGAYGSSPIDFVSFEFTGNATLQPGEYWIGLQAVCDEFADGQMFTFTSFLGDGESYRLNFQPPDSTLTRLNVIPGVPGDLSYRVVGTEPGEPCAADFDGSGTADVNDLLGFLGAFRTQGPGSDFDGSGSVDVNDLLGFLGAFRAGC